MVEYTEFNFLSSDGKSQIHVNKWLPTEVEPKGIVEIAHGVAEHGKRYDDFARHLASNGYLVVANDHLGHGESLVEDSPMVYFGEKESWWYAVDDVEKLREIMHMEYPKLPLFIFGHSMGSFITRSHLIRHGGKIDGAIICGTGFINGLLIKLGKLIANIEIKRFGRKGYSKLADKLAFGGYNDAFKPNRTEFDWLSVNEENVDEYIEDPLCGGRTTLGLFRELLDGLTYVNSRKHIETMSKEQPVLFISGDKDPVGEMGKGVKKAYQAFKDAGIKDVQMKLYKGLRHEILNEKEYQMVYDDVLNWLNDHLKIK